MTEKEIPKRRFALEEKDLAVEANENNKKAEKKEKTETQDSLERKYWHMKKQGSITPDQERTLRKEVLKGGGVVDEILQRRLNK